MAVNWKLIAARMVGGVLAMGLSPTFADNRVALVIGNAAYQHTPALRNTINDADAMAEVLTDLGYEVARINDANQAEIMEALIAFAGQTANAHTALIFYSGHGMELNGDNYIIPINARLSSEMIGRLESVPLDLLREAAGAASDLSVVILDACRNNTFSSSERSGVRGITRVISAPGEVIAFSTEPGKTADDGAGDLSPYTAALTERLRASPGQDVRVLFSSLQLRGIEQIPYVETGRMSAGLVALADPIPVDLCANVEIPDGGRCDVRGGVAVVTSAPEVIRETAPPVCASVVVPDGFSCGLSPDGRLVLTPTAGALQTPAPPAMGARPPRVQPITPSERAQRQYQCQTRSGAQGVSFGQKCWPLDTTEIEWSDIPRSVRGEITDASSLAGLTELRGLSLSRTQVSDVTPLSGLTGLQGLYLHNTQVSDVTPLSGLTGLWGLDLMDTQVSDVTPLSGLTGLRALYLNGTQVRDVTPLSGLTGLQVLWLHETQVSDVTLLSGLTGLRSLWLHETQVSDVTPLSGLTGLRALYLNGTQVSDLTPLSGMTELHYLWMPDGREHGGGRNTPENRAAVAEAIRTWRPAFSP